MILQNAYWFDVLPSRGKPDAAIDGKWLYFGQTPELHSWLERLDHLVENGQIAAAKVARKLPSVDPFPNKPCVLCVFTPRDRESKELARQVIKREFDVEVSIWKSDEQTLLDWRPGGWLHVEAEVNRLRDRIGRDGLGNEERSRLRELAEHLQQAIAGIEEPSRIAEIETSRTAALARQLAEDLRPPEVSTHSIIARLDDIQIQLTQLIAREQAQARAPQAALAAVTGDADEVFVIMPFAEKHVDTYDSIRRGVSRATDRFRTNRIDEIPGAIQITDEVRRAIRSAQLVICDLSDERPNVYYELGLAHGLAKQVICVARKGTIVHFDVYGLKTLFFDSYRSLEEQLEREIRALLQKAR